MFGADEPNYATTKDGKKLLAELGQPETVSVNNGGASVKLNLPRQAVALLVIDRK